MMTSNNNENNKYIDNLRWSFTNYNNNKEEEKELANGSLCCRINKKNNTISWVNPTSKAGEIIGKEYNLMIKIISMIPKNSERKNLRSSCRLYYHLCNDKKTFKPFVRYLDRNSINNYFLRPGKVMDYRPLIKFYQSTLVISLPKCNRLSTDCLNIHKSNIILNRHRIMTIKFESLNGKYLNSFRYINCFQNVNRVIYNPIYPISINLRIFNICDSLRPKILRFLCFQRTLIEKPTGNDREISRMIPRSVEVIELCCRPDEIEWLYEISKYFHKRRFEKLILSPYFVSHLTVLEDSEDKIYQLTRCFKNVNVCVHETLSYDVIDFFNSNNWLITCPEETNIKYTIKITLTKNIFIGYRVMEDEILPIYFGNKSNLQKIETFILNCDCNWRYPPPMYRSPFPYLFDMMRNLVTLELSMKIFSTTHEVDELFKNLNINLRNVKLCNCEKLTQNNIKILGCVCKNLTNLSLESILSSDMSIQQIISYFNNLQGLSIYFLYNQRNIETFINFIQSNDTHPPRIIKWPDINFVHLAFDSPDMNDVITLQTIEKETPRMSGVFIVRHHEKTDDYFYDVSEVIIQKSIVWYKNFMKIFTPPCWLGK